MARKLNNVVKQINWIPCMFRGTFIPWRLIKESNLHYKIFPFLPEIRHNIIAMACIKSK